MMFLVQKKKKKKHASPGQMEKKAYASFEEKTQA